MNPIEIRRYSDPDAVGYAGTISPEGGAWIVFVDNDGQPHLWIREDSLGTPAEVAARYPGAGVNTGDRPDRTNGDSEHSYAPVWTP